MSAAKPAVYDKIQLRNLQINLSNLAHVLVTLINGILATGNIPNKLKVSVVGLIYKKGNKKGLNNYRPIAILPTMLKK